MKASKTKVIIVWSLDKYEIRSDKLQTLQNLTDRLRDYVGEIQSLVENNGITEQGYNLQRILLGERTSLLVVCSDNDLNKINRLDLTNKSSDTTLIKANLLCELLE